MKRLFAFLSLAILMAVSCQREKEVAPVDQDRIQIADISVNLGDTDESGTRSLISIDDNDLKVAALFAFYRNSGEIAVYPDYAGDLAGKPIILETTKRSFNWALPVGVDLDIYAIVNYDYNKDLDTNPIYDYHVRSYIKDGCTRSDLEALNYTIGSRFNINSIINVIGIPMAGKKSVRLSSINDNLYIQVKRLFARYEVFVDMTGKSVDDYTMYTWSAYTRNVNSEIPLFQEGFKQTDHNKLISFDEASGAELSIINQSNGRNESFIVYVPENCQGDITPGASRYDLVDKELGDKVDNCTSLRIKFENTRTVGNTLVYCGGKTIDVYLGSDFVSNFDVKRNHKASFRVSVPNPLDIEDDVIIKQTEDFWWLKKEGEIIGEDPSYFTYMTTLKPKDCKFTVIKASTGEESDDLYYRPKSPLSYTYIEVSKKAGISIAPGTKYILRGGNEELSLFKDVVIEYQDPPVVASDVYQDIVLNCEVVSQNMTYSGHGQDMYVDVDHNDGNECYMTLSGQIKYNDEWHNLPLQGVGVPSVTFSITGYSSRFYSWGNVVNKVHQMWGDRDEVCVYFNDQKVASWYINYGQQDPSHGAEAFNLSVTADLRGQQHVYGSSHSITHSGVYGAGVNVSDNIKTLLVPVDMTGNSANFTIAGDIFYNGQNIDITKNSHVKMYLSGVESPFNFVYDKSLNGKSLTPGSILHFKLYYDDLFITQWNISAVPVGRNSVTFCCSVTSNDRIFLGSGEDMNVGVRTNNGNDVSVTVSGLIDIDGTLFSIDDYSLVELFVDGKKMNSFTWSGYQMPGDSETVVVKYEGREMASWVIRYN